VNVLFRACTGGFPEQLSALLHQDNKYSTDGLFRALRVAIVLVEQRVKLLEKQAFVAHADYVDFYEQEPPNESTKQKRIVDGKKQRTV